MRRRRFLLTAASVAAAAPFLELAGCGDANGDPQPVPPEDVVLRLPRDMYLHVGAPTEWWWHIGTLRAGSRVFGFEINAASFAGQGFAFTQIMLSDVASRRHYQRTTPFVPPIAFDPRAWAQSDVAKDWYARLGDADNRLSAIEVVDPGSGYTSDPAVEITGGGGAGASAVAVRDAASGTIGNVLLLNPGTGYTSPPAIELVGGGGSGARARALHTYVAMHAPAADPTRDMTVQALLNDERTGAEIGFDLTFSQHGRPFFVWGTGVNPGGASGSLETSNYYFSLTRMQAAGSIVLDGATVEVEGVTWMDHEYGAFGTAANPVKWLLQDMQLDNGFCVSNYATIPDGLPAPNRTIPSHATLQDADGAMYFVPSFMTPVGRTWTSPATGATFFTQFRVDIPSFRASLLVTTLMDEQEFPLPAAPTYEGVSAASGTFRHQPVAGTAWIEQAL
ncbi:MAG: lipocalin-like domain-containing protein [Thermodesulfobacteriota bacterium]